MKSTIKSYLKLLFIAAVVLTAVLLTRSPLPTKQPPLLRNKSLTSHSDRNQPADKNPLLAPKTAIIEQKPDSGVNLSADDLPSPDLSMLSFQDQQKAMGFFDFEHENWLSIKNFSAKYRVKLKYLDKNGKWVDDLQSSQTGSLEFSVAPLNDGTDKFPMQIQLHILDANDGQNLVRENVFDSKSAKWQWQDGQAAVNADKVKPTKRLFESDLLFTPLHFMVQSYPTDDWNINGMLNKETYFKERCSPARQSNQQETDTVFKGEPQYLFISSSDPTGAQYWFSAKTGELRQVSIFNPAENFTKTFRYEDYAQQEGQDRKFPKKLIMTVQKGQGENAFGWEYTLEFDDIKLNTDISADKFTPPSAGR